MPGKVGEGHGLADLPGFVEQLFAELAEAKAATKPFNSLTFPGRVSFGYRPDAFGCELFAKIKASLSLLITLVWQLREDEAPTAAVLFVQV